MYSLTGIEAFIEPNGSLDPTDTAVEVDTRVRVRVQLVIGSADRRVTPADIDAYAEVLRSHGVNADVTVVPDVGHDIAFIAPVFDALRRLVAVYERQGA